MSAVAPVAVRLDSLIRRLASGSDGEVVACVRAIGRQLDKAGLDFHHLADRLASAPEMPAESDAPPVFTDYAEAVKWVLATDCGELSAREIAFCEDMRSILRRWPAKPKQAEWLRSLVAKFGGRVDG